MLLNVLKALATRKVVSHGDLAKQLNVSEGLLARMIRDLAHKGYLSPRIVTHQGGCRGCSMGQPKACSGCASEATAAPQGWVLTAKGIETAKRCCP